MFDGTLDKYTGYNNTTKLNKYAKSYHANPLPIPTIHKQTAKKEVDRSMKIGVLKKSNNSQWLAPTLILSKKNGTV